MPDIRFVDKNNAKEIVRGLHNSYPSKSELSAHVSDTSVHMSAADKAKLDGIDEGATAYEHPTHAAKTGKPTADQTPAFGASFTVSQVTSDGYGHVTGMVDRDVTIPSTEATTASAGLMSATDKAKLDGIEDGATASGGSVTPLTTSEVDTVVGDTALTSSHLMDGTILTYFWGKLKDAFATVAHTHTKSQITDFAHAHEAGDITSGTLPVARGGTGATTAAGAVTNIVDGQAIEPASVAATGEVSAKSGTTTHKLTEKAQDEDVDNLEASIAYVESVTATANHAVGDYFMLGDVLMCATSAIATGEQITTSNATLATVQDQIDALRDSVDQLITTRRHNKTDVTMPAGGFARIDMDVSLSGYTPIGVVGWSGTYNQGDELCGRMTVGGNTMTFVVINKATSSKTDSFVFDVLYKRA